MYLTATIEGVTVDCLVDSGATLSVVRPSYFKAMCKLKDIKLQPTNGSLRMADGGLVTALGKAVLQLELQKKQKVQYTFIVADVEAAVVLGLDFLKSQFAVLDAHAGLLTLNGITHQCHDKEEDTHLYRVKLGETIVIQPGLEMILPGYIEGNPNFAMGLIEPHDKTSHLSGFLVAKAVVDPQLPDVPIRVMNFTGERLTLHKGMSVATCEPVSEEAPVDDTIGQVNRVQSTTTKDLPEHLQDLYNDCLPHLPDDNSKQRVQDLLHKYSSSFAKSKADMGVVWRPRVPPRTCHLTETHGTFAT